MPEVRGLHEQPVKAARCDRVPCNVARHQRIEAAPLTPAPRPSQTPRRAHERRHERPCLREDVQEVKDVDESVQRILADRQSLTESKQEKKRPHSNEQTASKGRRGSPSFTKGCGGGKRRVVCSIDLRQLSAFRREFEEVHKTLTTKDPSAAFSRIQ